MAQEEINILSVRGGLLFQPDVGKKEAKMKARIMIWLSSMVIGLAVCNDILAAEVGKAIFKDTQGKSIGSAMLFETANGVLIETNLTNLPPGPHGFHIHQIGRCDLADGFKSAGSHYSPNKREHGLIVTGGPHAGDMPNQFVGSDGKLQSHILNTDISLAPSETSIFKNDGTALVIHAKADDYRSQPAGDAGDRIACAVIERSGG